MKRVVKIRFILLGLLATYNVYVTLTESLTKTEHIVMIICLAASLIDDSLITAIKKRVKHEK
ncbi:hypothetical protein EG832_16545 [bacterium]|nr:hypothetical protein [bacterium]